MLPAADAIGIELSRDGTIFRAADVPARDVIAYRAECFKSSFGQLRLHWTRRWLYLLAICVSRGPAVTDSAMVAQAVPATEIHWSCT